MTVEEIIKKFNEITGDSAELVLLSNYFRLGTTRRGGDRVEILGIRRKHLENSRDIRDWFCDWINNDYKINSKLGLRLCRMAVKYDMCDWIADCTISDLDRIKKNNQNRGHTGETICTEIHPENRHGTKEEDKQLKIDAFMKINGRLTKVQIKTSVKNSSVNI